MEEVFKMNPYNRIVLAYLVDNIYYKCKDSSGNITEVLKEDVPQSKIFAHNTIKVTW